MPDTAFIDGPSNEPLRDAARPFAITPMTINTPITLALVPLLLLSACTDAPPGADPAQERPNILLVLVDDLGYGDLGCYGNPNVRTPHIDQLAREGALFTDAYAASPVCSPSRAGLLTGRFTATIGLTNAIGPASERWAKGRKLTEPDNAPHLPFTETTVAELLRAAGYATASIGKWHLGNTGSLPQDHGFDVNFSGNNIGSQRSMFGPDYGIRLGPVPEGEYLTDRLQAEAEAFIRSHRDQPFFVYLSHYAVHRPIGAKAETIAHYPEHTTGPFGLLPEYAAMIEDVDTAFGRMRSFLVEEGLTDNTIIILTSDNGAVRQWGSNGNLRGAKGLVYEGGIRVPLIIWRPGLSDAGRVITDPMHAADLLPTILDLAGLGQAIPGNLDGASLAPLLDGPAVSLPERPLLWHFPHYNMHGSRPATALRQGDFKLIHFYETDSQELYDLRQDPGETRDLAPEQPGQLAAMVEALEAGLARTGALHPLTNPEYSGKEPETFTLLPFESTRTAPGADPTKP